MTTLTKRAIGFLAGAAASARSSPGPYRAFPGTGFRQTVGAASRAVGSGFPWGPCS